MDVESSLKPVVASIMTLQHHSSSGLHQNTKRTPKSTPRLRSTTKRTPKSNPDLQRRIALWVDPYAYTQHIKVPKHFVYIQYGYGIQSGACCGLNNHCKGGPICPYTAYQGAKTSNMDMGSSLEPVVVSIMTLKHHLGSGLPPTPPKKKLSAQSKDSVRVESYAHSHYVKVPKHFI
jgi:hypothetical protein